MPTETEKTIAKANKVIEAIENPEAQTARAIDRWRDDPESFVREAIGVNERTRRGLVISTQQKRALKELGNLVKAKYKAWLAENRPEQNVVLNAEELDYARKLGLSIMSGKGTGKDALSSWAIIWFMTCFPFPKIPCTATSAGQIESVLWSEISKWLNLQDDEGKYVCTVRDLFELQSTKMFNKELPKEQRGKQWFAEARSVNKHDTMEAQAQTLAGRHEDFMLYVADEASAVPDPVFTIFEGGLTGKVNIILMIFNPTQRTGFAVDSHFGTEKQKEVWVRLRWNSEDSEIVPSSHTERLAEKYGRESNTFRVQVLGLPPKVDDDTLIPDDWIYSAIEKRDLIKETDFDPVVIGVDPALGGGDEAVICVRKGAKMLAQFIYPIIADPDELGLHVVNKAIEFEADDIEIDSIGIGAGVYSYVKQYYDRDKVHAVDVRRSSSDESKFVRLRDELWWRMRERFRVGTIAILDDEILRGQLSSIKLMPADVRGRIKIEDKRDFRKRAGGGSLDRADALMITFRRSDALIKGQKEQDEDDDAYDDELVGAGDSKHSWMGA